RQPTNRELTTSPRPRREGGHPTMDARKEREVAFHNFRFSTGMRGEDEKQSDGVEKFYSVAEASRSFYIRTIRDGCKDKRVLEYGYGTNSNSFNLGMREARVTGIDISDVAVGVAQERATQMGLSNVDFQVMDAESLKFPDSTFDLIC